MATPGENEQDRAAAPAERLEWQSELDSAMADIDTRLRHPRRRASDQGTQPDLPELAQVNLTSELLDEIAWRVSEQLRRSNQPAAVPAPVAAAPAVPTPTEPPLPVPPPRPQHDAAPSLPDGIAISIRLRTPLLNFRFWPFRRRRRRSATMLFSDFRAS